ncbi:hypothetical protein MAHJHV45_42940 [Mycobacterium avium subsp. hominissuis]
MASNAADTASRSLLIPRKLGEPTDKNRRNVTTETKVTQGISLCVLVIRKAEYYSASRFAWTCFSTSRQ